MTKPSLCIGIILVVCFGSAAVAGRDADEDEASPIAAGNERTLDGLRMRFKGACGKEFSFVKGVLSRRSTYHGGESYWLAFAKPKQTGVYFLKYRYKYNDELYDTVERTFYLRVREKGASRGVYNHRSSSYLRVNLGDTVIFPVRLAEYRRNFSDHTFSLVRSGDTDGDAALDGPRKLGDDVPAATVQVGAALTNNFEFVRQSSNKSLFRNGGFIETQSAEFRALKPGHFSLFLDLDHTVPRRKNDGAILNRIGEPKPYQGFPYQSMPDRFSLDGVLTDEGFADVGFPVVVDTAKAPLTILAATERVSGFDASGREVSSSGENYMTTPMIIQVGEIFSLPVSTRRFSVKEEREGSDRREPPGGSVLRARPFRVDPNEAFNEWIMDIMPKV